MTTDEAKDVCEILVMADDECPYCARDLVQMFLKEWPQFRAIARVVWNNEFADSDYSFERFVRGNMAKGGERK